MDNAPRLKLHLGHYIQEMLAEYKDYIKKSLRPKRVPISSGDHSSSRGLSRSPRSTQAVVLPVVRSQASVCGISDSLRYLVRGITACAVLCFRQGNSLGSTPPPDGVPGRVPKSEAHLPPPHRSQSRPALRVRQLRLGEQLVPPVHVWKT